LFVKPVRAAVAAVALAAVALGGPAGVAAAREAAPPQVVAQELLPCAVLDELESSLRELASSADPGAVKDRVDVVIETLEEIRSGVPALLVPAYDALVSQLKNLRAELERNPTAEVVRKINAVARQLADLVALVPCL
jgi:hypothetical protein